MFAHLERYCKGLIVGALALALLALSGCGGSDSGEGGDGGAGAPPSESAPDQGGAGQPTPDDPDVADADPDDLEVIEAWSAALAEGDVEGAAELFAVPSVAENGEIVIDIETERDAILFNRTLPCAAEVIAAETTGESTTATFELSDRPGGGCGGGAGGTAATSFMIEDGKITDWRRVPTPEESEQRPPAPGTTT